MRHHHAVPETKDGSFPTTLPCGRVMLLSAILPDGIERDRPASIDPQSDNGH